MIIFFYRFESEPHFDDTSGYFLVGGAEGRLGSFHGFMSRVIIYRDKVVKTDQVIAILPSMK